MTNAEGEALFDKMTSEAALDTAVAFWTRLRREGCDERNAFGFVLAEVAGAAIVATIEESP